MICFGLFRASRNLEIKNSDSLEEWKKWDDVLKGMKIERAEMICFGLFRASRDLEIKNSDSLEKWKRWDGVLACVKVHTLDRTPFPSFGILFRFKRSLFFFPGADYRRYVIDYYL